MFYYEDLVDDLIRIGRANGLSDKEIENRLMEIYEAHEEGMIRDEERRKILNIFKTKRSIVKSRED